MVMPLTGGSESPRCPVCEGEVAIAPSSNSAENADKETAHRVSAGEARCKRCQCVLRLDHNAELMIRMSKTSVQRIASELAEWRTSGVPRLLMDFGDVQFLGSEFLNQLIVLHREKRCLPVLCNLTPEIEEVFQITRLNRVFEIRVRGE